LVEEKCSIRVLVLPDWVNRMVGRIILLKLWKDANETMKEELVLIHDKGL
jgi:hypothetical protein